MGPRNCPHKKQRVPTTPNVDRKRSSQGYKNLVHTLSLTHSSPLTSDRQLVLSCLLDLLLVLEKPPSSDCRRTLCRHDDVLHLVLTHMEAEHKVALRRVYASALPLYVERCV